MLTLISNFYNEEFLIRPWLLHHREMFDHGVLIDYWSTDRTAEIVKELCPTWEIREPQVGPFLGPYNDKEVMDIESEFPSWKPHLNITNDFEVMKAEGGTSCWKMSLNTTEFLFCPDLRKFVKEFETKYPNYLGIRTNGVVMVDMPEHKSQYDPNRPLLQQKHHGYLENILLSGRVLSLQHREKVYWLRKFVEGRSRLLHKAKHGHYGSGRHACSLPSIFPRSYGLCPESPLFLCWFGFSPWDHIKGRVGSRMGGAGAAPITMEAREYRWRHEVALADDLLKIPRYAAIYEEYSKNHWPMSMMT